MTRPAVDIHDLVVERGKHTVLPGLSCAVKPSMVTGLLGPSGGGKSTLIRSIIGVQMVVSGTVAVLGEPAGSPTNRARVGYMAQDVSVYEDLSVAENLKYFGRVLGVPADDAARVMRQVALSDAADQLVADLSGGQRSRASLAVALLGSPQLLVLDEPTVGLDPALRRDLWQLFHELAAGGVTLLISSHVMDEASRCDELILLREGVILAHDTPERILARTRTTDMEHAFLALVAAA